MRNGRTSGSASVSSNDSGNFTLNTVSSYDCQHNCGKNLHHGDVLNQKLNSYQAEKAENSRSPSLVYMSKECKSAATQCYQCQKGHDRRYFKDDGVQEHGEDAIASIKQCDESDHKEYLLFFYLQSLCYITIIP